MNDATVAGSFSGAFNEPLTSATTDASGVAVVTATGSVKGSASFSLCVDGVTASLPYDSTANVETCDAF